MQKMPLKTPAQVGIFGAPYDLGVSNRPGCRFAPEAIRRASAMLCEDLPLKTVDFGDLLFLYRDTPEKTLEEIGHFCTSLLKGSIFPVCLGGDHSITLPILRAMKAYYKRPIPLVHSDAHPDTWEECWGMPYGHGSFLYHAIKENLIMGIKVL